MVFRNTDYLRVIFTIEEAEKFHPAVCAGGYHLFNPLTKKEVTESLLEEISEQMKKYRIQFYTCHCTGENAFQYLAKRMKNVSYLSCGETINS